MVLLTVLMLLMLLLVVVVVVLFPVLPLPSAGFFSMESSSAEDSLLGGDETFGDVGFPVDGATVTVQEIIYTRTQTHTHTDPNTVSKNSPTTPDSPVTGLPPLDITRCSPPDVVWPLAGGLEYPHCAPR